MQDRDLRISVRVRTELDYFLPLFRTSGNQDDAYREASEISYKYNSLNKGDFISAAQLYATGVLHLFYQNVTETFLRSCQPEMFSRTARMANSNFALQDVLTYYADEFPSPLLMNRTPSVEEFTEESVRGFFIHRVMLENPAVIKSVGEFIKPKDVVFPSGYQALTAMLIQSGSTNASMLGDETNLFDFLIKPAKLYPDSLVDQMNYILRSWNDLIPEEFRNLILRAIDFYNEENKPNYGPPSGNPETFVPEYSYSDYEYEAFTDDRNWMPNVVMIAKSTLVWLDQLTKKYKRPITRLDQIPDAELDELHNRGFTALWLIGLWDRSPASKKIKQLCGNPEAEASAYSLRSSEISASIGGWEALEKLKDRCLARGIRLASDMVPNHTGMDSKWVIERPDLFISQDYPPFPSYTYNGPDLSEDPNVELKIEDHYYDKTDAAVTFRRRDRHTGKCTYIFHGNDGTSMPWNDTAQLDFLNPDTREAVYQEIKHVAQNFSIIRFDAAMTLAKRHIQRLWYPKPGSGGDIAGRTAHGLTDKEFNERIPQEFWREVVDRMAEELPDTLLLAEAFWMMEGYFVRTLGMHRVYNSAFMNMLKKEENKKYKDTIKNTIDFEPEILKRFVNFMNNPDEETAIAQFGDGDKYFGVCTLLATMPGLPLFGHGQVEGLREKYGMEYSRAYWDETENQHLIDEHYRRIFPLIKKRYLFSDIKYFQIFDLIDNGNVYDSAFCYVNGTDKEKALILYNNQYEAVQGHIRQSAPKLRKEGEDKNAVTVSIAEALGLTFSPRRFVIMRSFQSGMTYIIPSLKIFDDGIFVRLNGYETRVMLGINEVEDIDGSYEELYKEFQNTGIPNLRLELAKIKLRPIYQAMESIRRDEFFDLIRSLRRKKVTSQTISKVALKAGEAYSYLAVIKEQLRDDVKDLLPYLPGEVQPLDFVDYLKRLCSALKSDVFSSASQILDEFDLILACAIFLYPFMQKDMSIFDAMNLSDSLLLSYFFREQGEERGWDENTLRKISHEACILLCSGSLVDDSKKDYLQQITTLLEDKGVIDYLNVNTYKDVTWFKKEGMQEFIVLTAISKAIEGHEDAEEFMNVLLDREIKAEYRLNRFTE